MTSTDPNLVFQDTISIFNVKQVYWRRYESRRSPKPTHCNRKRKKIKYGEERRMELFHRAMWHVAVESWQWIHQVAAPCNLARGSRMTWHWIRPNIRHIGILFPVSISTISPQSTCHSAPVYEILSKSDAPWQKNDVVSIFEMANLRHLRFYGSNNGFFEKPMYNFVQVVNRDCSSELLSFWENRVFAFWRQTDRRTHRWTGPTH